MKLKVRDLASAGLPAEGVYKMLIEDVSEDEGESAKGPWSRIDVNFRLLESRENGPLKFGPMVFDKFFVSSDSGLDRFLKLYSAVTGAMPEAGELDSESGELAFDTRDLLDDLRGREVWGVVVYGKKKNEMSGKFEVVTGWSFSQDADGVRMPRNRQTE